MKEQVRSYLDEHHIIYDEINLPEGVFPPAEDFWISHRMERCKNLFFRDNHGKNHYLVIFGYYKKLDIKKLSDAVGRGSLSFASGWRLDKYLGLRTGFLSVFGILNDKERHVQIVIDRELEYGNSLSFLPNTEGESFIKLEFNELKKFILKHGNRLILSEISE